MKKQFRKSFVLIVTMEYQNVRASVNFSHLIIGPGMLPGLCNKCILFISSRRSPCRYFFPSGFAQKSCLTGDKPTVSKQQKHYRDFLLRHGNYCHSFKECYGLNFVFKERSYQESRVKTICDP